MSNIKDLVENPHSVYTNNLSYWDFLLQAYEGGKDYIGTYVANGQKVYANGKAVDPTTNTNLFQHKKERAEDFKDRLKMSYYYNFCSPIIDIYTNHLFKKPVISDFKNIEKSVDHRKENIDKMNSSIGEFRKEVSELSQVYGHVFVIIDMPSVDGSSIMSVQDKIDNDIFPYFSIFHPQSVINWSLDQFGNPYWLLVRETVDANFDFANYDKDKKENTFYRIWTRSEWILFNGTYEEIARGTHDLGRVPISVFMNKKSKKVRHFLGISSIADIAYIARDVYNSCSELKQILRDQTFAILTLQGNSSDYDEVSVGTSKALLYPKETNAPGFISPPSSNAEVMFKHIDKQISTMFRLAKLEGGSAQFKGQGAVEQSGVSKAWDFNETNQALAEKALNMEDGEAKLWDIFSLWETGKPFEGKVDYPNEFNVQDLKQDLDEAEQMFRLQLGKDFNNEVKKSIIKKKFPRMEDRDIDKMVEQAGQEADEAAKTVNRQTGSKLFDRIKNAPVKTSDQTDKKGGDNAGRKE